LYAKISSQADADNSDSMRDVEDEIGEFLARFPDDQRAEELRRYQQQLDLDRMHRRLQLQVRRNGVSDPGLLPVESLYLEAMSVAATSPESAVAMLESLVALYGADLSREAEISTGQVLSAGVRSHKSDDEERRVQAFQLAEHQLELLRAQIAKQTERQLAALRERLAVAAKVSDYDSEKAGDMYRAMIRLYGDATWAHEIVTEARQQLEQDKETGRQGDKENGR
jgi:chorismate mutase